MIAGLMMAAAILSASDLSVSIPCQPPAWRPVYHHDRDGRPLSGSKDDLLTAVRRGDPIRIAWGGKFRLASGQTHSVEHSADPVFVTIIDGQDVVVQIPEHIAQAAYHDEAKATFESGSVMWRGLFSTTGRFDAIWVDRATGAEVRKAPQRAAVTWLAFAPEPRCETRAPLALAVEGGVVGRTQP